MIICGPFLIIIHRSEDLLRYMYLCRWTVHYFTILFYNMLRTPAECQLIGADSNDNVGGNVGRAAGSSCFEGVCIPFFKSVWHNIHTRLTGRARRPALRGGWTVTGGALAAASRGVASARTLKSLMESRDKYPI
jgi:hypothetical protein